MKNVLFIALILAGGAGWILYAREHRITRNYAAREEMRASITNLGKNASVAIFDSVDAAGAVHFSTQVKTTTAQGVYTNYVAQVGTMTPDGRIYRTNKAGIRIDTLQGLPANTPITIELTSDPAHAGQWLIQAIYIVE